MLALAALPRAGAQDVLREKTSDRVEVAPGVRAERSVEARRNSTLAIEVLSLDPRALRGSLRVVRDESGAPLPLARALLNTDALGAYGLPGESAALVLEEGRLHAWPVEGPALIVEPEGSVLLAEVGALAAPALEVSPGVRLPLRIGRATAPDPAGARILPGPIAGEEVSRLVSPSDDAWVLVGERPRAPWLDVAPHGGAGRAVTLRAEPFAGSPRDVRGQEALLVYPRTQEAGGRREARTFTALLGMPEELASARFVVRAGEWLLRGAAVTGTGAGNETAPRRAIGVNAATGEVHFVAAPQGTRQPGASRAELCAALLEAGATDAIELPAGDPLLLVPGRLQGVGREREDSAAELVLALSRRPYRTGPGYGFERIRITDHVLALEEVRAHPYSALGDSRLDAGGRLDGIWAAKFSRAEGARNEAILLLARRAEIGAIDLVHASRAGFSPSLNLRRARIYLSEGAAKPWKLVAEVNNARPVPRQRIDISPPVAASRVKLEILDPAFVEGADTVRLAEVVVWGRN